MTLFFILVAFLLFGITYWLWRLNTAQLIKQLIGADTSIEIKQQTEPLERVLMIFREGEKEQQTALLFALERALLDHRNRDLRYQIIKVLSQIKDIQVLETLVKALSDPDGYVRDAAEEALRDAGEQGMRALEIALHDQDPNVRYSAVKAFRGRGEQDVEVLIPLLRDRDKEMRRIAAKRLAFMGKRGREALKAALNDNEEEIRIEAAKALELRPHPPKPPIPPDLAAGENYLGLLVSTVAPIYRTLTYTGEAVLPKKVYVGDAQNISLAMKLKNKIPELLPENLRVQDTKGEKQVHLQIQERDRSEQFLEVELQAAAFTVDGEKKQRCLLGQETISYQWNCYFPNYTGPSFLDRSLR